jgi:lipoate-protein ligase A
MNVKLIVDPPLAGAQNMARDVALLESGLPCLRFYQWAPPCVSVGYFQQIDRDINLEYLKQEGIDLVRRPTGGRAVLHDRELTYSIVLPEIFVPGGVIPSYIKIASVFYNAFEELGLKPEMRGPDGRPDRGGVCFAGASAYEIAVGGRKILGSAQLRRDGNILQHGSLLLSVDYERHARCMKGVSSVSPADLRNKMTGIRELLGEQMTIDELIKIICFSFQSVFDAVLVRSIIVA